MVRSSVDKLTPPFRTTRTVLFFWRAIRQACMRFRTDTQTRRGSGLARLFGGLDWNLVSGANLVAKTPFLIQSQDSRSLPLTAQFSIAVQGSEPLALLLRCADCQSESGYPWRKVARKIMRCILRSYYRALKARLAEASVEGSALLSDPLSRFDSIETLKSPRD